MEKNRGTEYRRAIAKGALSAHLGGSVMVTGIDRIVKTGRRVKLTGDLTADACPDAERFHIILQRETDLGWVCVDSRVKMRRGKIAATKA